MLIMNLFYSSLIVPLFNKQTPLEDGELKTAIKNYAEKVGFTLNNIFVILDILIEAFLNYGLYTF